RGFVVFVWLPPSALYLSSFAFFFSSTSSDIYTLSLHDALPICSEPSSFHVVSSLCGGASYSGDVPGMPGTLGAANRLGGRRCSDRPGCAGGSAAAQEYWAGLARWWSVMRW